MKVDAHTDGREHVHYTGRVIKIIDRARHRVLGVFRALPSGGGRLIPIDKKSQGRELSIPQGATHDAEDGDLIAAEVARSGRYGLPTARVTEKLARSRANAQ